LPLGFLETRIRNGNMQERPKKQTSSSTASIFENAPPIHRNNTPAVAENRAPAAGFQSQAPAMSQGKTTVGQWLELCKNEILSMGKSFVAVLKPQMPNTSDADILRQFWSTLHVYLIDKDYLWGCDPVSIQLEALKALQRGLNFAIENEAHLVPYAGKARLQPGYKGDLKMARRSSSIAFIDAFDVREHDFIEIEFGDSPKVIHKLPKFGTPRGTVLGCYAVARDKHGNTHVEAMTALEIIDHHRRFSKAKNKGPYAGLEQKGVTHENFVSYGLKSVVHRICRRKLDLSPEQAQQFAEEDELARPEPPRGAPLLEVGGSAASLNQPIEERREEEDGRSEGETKGGAAEADSNQRTHGELGVSDGAGVDQEASNAGG
jgi:phage RecT family recombinase